MAMSKGNPLRVLHDGTTSGGQLTRREMVQRLLAGMSAAGAWPLVGASHPIRKLLRNDAVLEEAEKLGAADWKLVFLNAEQDESLIALAEGIVPGWTKYQVNRYIDVHFSLANSEKQKRF